MSSVDYSSQVTALGEFQWTKEKEERQLEALCIAECRKADGLCDRRRQAAR
jgi:hypothetical protein